MVTDGVYRNTRPRDTGIYSDIYTPTTHGITKYIYIYVCVQKKIVIERSKDLIYLNFVATDFFPKIISPSAGENSSDSA